jgi:DNA-3-methyladenine glycosylase I
MSSRLHDDGLKRCSWAGPDQVYIDYHDFEWGRPVRDSQALFEHLCLEGFQAGLSWITILKRRPGFRLAFANFEVPLVAEFDESKVQELRNDQGIIRNELKIRAAIHNARLIRDQDIDLASTLWSFAPPTPLTASDPFSWRTTSPESDALSKELKRLGFKFVGSTSMYAMMQAAGLIRDHDPECFRRAEDVLELAV